MTAEPIKTDQPKTTAFFGKIANLVHAGVFASICGSVLGYFGSFHFLLDLFSHFRLVYATAILIGIAIALLQKNRRLQFFWLIGFLINFAAILPLFWGGRQAESLSGTNTLRVMTINVLRKNDEKEAAVQAVVRARPDIVIGIETDKPWADAFEKALKTDYPYAKIADRADNYGVLIFSRHPIEKVEVFESPVAYVPTIRAEIKIDQTTIVVYGIHTFPPLSAFNAHSLQSQLADVAKRIKAEKSPVILMGDLNSTPWSSYFRSFLAGSGLVDSTRGFGPQSSWPSNLPKIGIPIDHILTSPEIVTTRRKVLGDVGSDHRPVVADLLLPRSAAK
jgi:endonuclease/exonuclease/phosphatase (EEP) superfamily protein YafD